MLLEHMLYKKDKLILVWYQSEWLWVEQPIAAHDLTLADDDARKKNIFFKYMSDFTWRE